MRLRDDYVADAAGGVGALEPRASRRAGIDFRIALPHVAFNRRIGEFAAIHADTDGNVLDGGGLGGAAGRVAAVGRRRPRSSTA